MHERLAANSKWGRRLEGSYIPKHLLTGKEPPEQARPYIHMGKLSQEKYGDEWLLEKHVLREQGIIIQGPPLVKLITPISAADLRKSSLNLLVEWWQPLTKNPAKLADHEYQVYAVLTMCRILYTFSHGKLVSKPQAACWAKRQIQDCFHDLIDNALRWQKGETFSSLAETLDLINFTIAACNSEDLI